LNTIHFISKKIKITFLVMLTLLSTNVLYAQICSSPSITMNVVTQNLRCNGDNSGSISVTVNGGTIPSYTYSLFSVVLDPIIINNHPINNYTFSNLPADNNYFLVIQVPIGGGAFAFCSQSITLTQPPPLSISTGLITNVSCNGGNNGAIDAVVTGGPTAPYIYSWSNGATTEDISGLAAGNYTLTVTDGNACTTSQTYTVTEPLVISSTATVSQITCSGLSNGAIDLTPIGGTAPYSNFVWSNGATTEDISGLAAGTYSVTFKDANGCNAVSTSFTINPAPSLITSTAVLTQITCNGLSNGTIDLTPTGGTAPYGNFVWSNGATTEDISGLAPGSYSVTFKDANGCSSASASFTINPAPAALTSAAVVTQITCNGLTNGAINLTPAGGVAPYGNFVWSNGATTEDISGLASGTYSVTYKDANGCSSVSASFTINPAPTALTSTAVITQITCNGLSNGAINITPTGGKAPYSNFVWSNGATTEDISGLAAGTYSVTFKDANGCSSVSAPFTINPAPVALSSTAVITQITCNGLSNGAIDLTPAGGTAPYSNFVWSNGATTEDISSLTAGTYSVTFKDANGCSSTSASFTINPAPTALTSTAVLTQITCNGLSNGAINLTPAGGTAPYSNFVWSNGATTEDISGLTAGTYSVTYKDANGCSSVSASYTINPAPAALTSTALVTQISCNGVATGAIDLTVLGGISPYTFLWNTGATSEDISSLIAGTYSVVITDAGGCTTTSAPFTINPAPAALTSAAVVTQITCNGLTNGAINFTPGGGVSPYSNFVWSNGATTEDISGLAAGTYSVTFKDANGCTSASASFTINPAPAALTSTAVVTQITCNGLSNGAIDLTPAGGTAPYSNFIWSNGATTEDISGLLAGTYSVTYIDANGCGSVSTSYTINPAPPAITSTAVVTQITCNGLSNGAIDLTPAGGTAPYTFLWSNGAITEDISNVTVGSYTVTVKDSRLCSRVFGPFAITAPTPITATSTITHVLCNGGTNGSIIIAPNGGSAPYTYLWSNGVTSKDNINVPAGSYTLTITDANSCSKVVGPFVVSQPVPIISTGTMTHILCNGSSTGAITLANPTGGLAPYTYLWSTGAITKNVSGLSAGTYTVVISDANSCSSTPIGFTITQPALISSTGAVTNVTCNGGNSGAINLTNPTGGVGPYTYSWSNGVTTKNNPNLIAGSYTVTIKDANNCTLVLPFTITEPAIINTTLTPANATCNGTATGGITITNPTGGAVPYTYAWSNGVTTQNNTSIVAGTYTLIITDSKNCNRSFGPINITEPAAISATGVIVSPTCNGVSTGSITLSNPTGGTVPYTYLWSNGASTKNITNIPAGNYTVVITDNNGCSNPTPISFIIPNGPSITGTASATPAGICSGGGTTINASLDAAYTPALNTYSFNGGLTFQAGPSFAIPSILVDTVVSVVMKDVNGCLTNPILVSISTSTINATLDQTQLISCNGSADGQLTLNVIGSAVGFMYSINGGAFQPSNVFSNLSAGTYVVMVDNGTTCNSSYSSTLTNPPVLTIGNKTIVDVDPCTAPNTGSVLVTTNGGNLGKLFTITPSGTSQTDSLFSNLTIGSYDIVVEDSKGCTASVTAVISQPSVITISPVVTSLNCSNPLSGAIDITISGGIAPYTYLWSDGSTSEDLINLTSGTYTVNVVDNKGCSVSLAITVDPAPIITGTATATPATVCSGQSTTVTAVFDAPFIPAANGYSFDDGLTFQASNTFAIGSVVADTTVLIVLLDNNTCLSNTIIVDIATSKIDASIVESNAISCNGGNDGALTVSVVGSSIGYTYSINGGAFQASNVFSGLVAGTYTIIIDDGSACNSSYIYVLTEPLPMTIGIKTIVDVNPCAGGNNGSVLVTTNGGNFNKIFTINPSGQSQTDSLFIGLMAGSYSITVVDSKLCTATTNATVIEPSGVNAAAIVPIIQNVICAGRNEGTVRLTNVTGGAGPYTYSLNNVTNATSIFTLLLAGNYTMVITDANSCNTDYNFTITEPLPVLYATNITPSSCTSPDGSIEILNVTGGTSPYKYSINDGATYGNTTIFTNLGQGTYPVRVIDVNGCSTGYNVIMPTKIAPVPYIRIQEPLCNGSGEGFIVIDSISGGVPLFQFKFNGINVGSSTVYSNLTVGSYPLVITDQACTYNIDSFFVYNTTTMLYDTLSSTLIPVGQPDIITGMVFSTDADRYQSTGSIGVYNIAGGTPGYIWSSDNTNFNPVTSDTVLISGLKKGDQTIYVQDVNGCEASFTITIHVEFFIPNLITPNKDGKNDRFEIMALPAGSQLLIVNRWGNKVYTSSDYDNSWDADEDSDGVYYYELQIPSGKTYKGWVEVIR
jgi:gliding motility-associated-like protein